MDTLHPLFLSSWQQRSACTLSALLPHVHSVSSVVETAEARQGSPMLSHRPRTIPV